MNRLLTTAGRFLLTPLKAAGSLPAVSQPSALYLLPRRWIAKANQKYHKHFNRRLEQWGMHKCLETFGIEKRLRQRGSRRLLMMRVLEDSKFLSWGHQASSIDEKRRLDSPVRS